MPKESKIQCEALLLFPRRLTISEGLGAALGGEHGFPELLSPVRRCGACGAETRP